MSDVRTLTPTGIRSDAGRPWVTAHTRCGYVDLDTHGFARPLSPTECRHLARRLELAANALDGRHPEAVRTPLALAQAHTGTEGA